MTTTYSGPAQEIRAALAAGVPNGPACEACLRVLTEVAPLAGALEPALQRIASVIEASARGPRSRQRDVGQVSEAAVSEVETAYYFDAAFEQQRIVDALTAERDAADGLLQEARCELAHRERALAGTRAELAQKTQRIDELVREMTSKQRHLSWAEAEKQRHIERYEEGRMRMGHATRMQLDENMRLEERIAGLRQEIARRLRTSKDRASKEG